MNRIEIFVRLKEIFDDVFDEGYIINENTKAEDIDEWDSLAQITLIASIENEFDIKIPSNKISYMKSVESIINVIEETINA